jgi:YVTN family beta-propeller protein
MKSISFLKRAAFLLLLVPFFNSCTNDNNPVETPTVSTGLLVLNQGSYAGNNAELTYYDFTTNTATNNFFSSVNNRGLGDTGQDILKYGSKIYISVYGSSLIDVIDLKGTSKKQIVVKDAKGNAQSPRSLASYNGKIYVTLFDGFVARIDTTTLASEAEVAVGPNPEGIAITNGKIYVANSGGMNYPNYDKTVSVINLASFTETKKIDVVINPGKLQADAYGDVYLISVGNYGSIPYTFQRINSTTDAVTTIPDITPYNFTISGDKAYCYYYNYGTKEKKFMVYDVKNDVILSQSFITDGTTIKTIPYSINVNPANGDVYIGESDGNTTGSVNCFSADGKFKFSFPAGYQPTGIAFITNK